MHPLIAVSRHRRALLAGAILLAAAGCQKEDEPSPVAHSVTEVKGTAEERVHRLRGILRLTPELSATILDAHALADRVGDGRIGPSDLLTFISLRVAPGDLALWRAQLTPIIDESAKVFAAPASPVPWWVNASEFTALQFFTPGKLTGFDKGWIGIDTNSGAIYIYTFTT